MSDAQRTPVGRRRSEVVDVGRTRPVSLQQFMEERERLNRGDQKFDAQLESRHTVSMRQYRREAEAGAADAACDAAVAAAAVEAKRKYLYEVKQQLLRAHQESELLAAGDIALTANFAALDEDLYRTARLHGLEL